MASSRRRPSSGFSTPEVEYVEDTIESVKEEKEGVVEEEVVVEEPKKETVEVKPSFVARAQPAPPAVKRHPRNIPKFSPLKD